MMNLRFFSLFGLSVLGLSFLLGNARPAQAAVTPGALVKGSGPSVYYVSEEGTRYAFPDLATYASWYADFSAVQLITDTELAQMRLGGLVTMRPGVRMVKIQTDPRVYAVARGGVLRWVQTEALAEALYGTRWNEEITDIPDAFFTNYRIDAPITDASVYVPANERAAITTIDLDRRARQPAPVSPLPPPTPPQPPTSTPPTPTPPPAPPAVTIEGQLDILSAGPYRPGDVVTILASVRRGFVDRISLSHGTGTALAQCATNPCRTDFTIPAARVTSTIPLRAVFSVGEGETRVATTATRELVVLPSQVSNDIQILRQAEVMYGASRVIRVEVGFNLEARVIRLMMDDTLLKECTATQTCESYETEVAPGGTVHTLYAIVTDRDYRSVYSPISTFRVVQ